MTVQELGIAFYPLPTEALAENGWALLCPFAMFGRLVIVLTASPECDEDP